MSQQPPQRPEKVFRAKGGIKAKVWRRESQLDGQARVNHSITIEKRYRDPDTKEWQNSATFFVDDLPRLRAVLGRAYEFAVVSEEDPSAPRDDE